MTLTQTWLRERTLPSLITRENRFHYGILLFLLSIALYLASNHIHFFPPQTLPRTWIDLIVPFVPNTVWIYISEYVYFMLIYVMCQDMLNLNRYFFSIATLQIISCAIFWVWPTTFPRELFPLPDTLNSVTFNVFHNLRQTDSPANCCPSLHVSSVYLASFVFLNEQKKYFPFFFIWGTAIAISTLTTKQHYLIDVVMGFLMAAGHYWYFYKQMSYRPALHANR